MTWARRSDLPEPGFFRIKLVKPGPWVGAAIFCGPSLDPETGTPLDRSWLWETWINGRLMKQPSPDPTCAGVFIVWLHADSEPIDERTYRFLIQDREWCRRHAPDSPEANPAKRPDISRAIIRSLLPNDSARRRDRT